MTNNKLRLIIFIIGIIFAIATVIFYIPRPVVLDDGSTVYACTAKLQMIICLIITSGCAVALMFIPRKKEERD